MGYFETHRDQLRELFGVLGKDHDWRDDRDAMTQLMFDHWLGAEHGPGAGKEQYDQEQVAAARPLLSSLGLTDEVLPTSDSYDEIIVMGAAGVGLYRRADLVRRSAVRAEGLTILAGQRPHSGMERDGGLADWLSTSGRFPASPGWEVPEELGRLVSLAREAGLGDLEAARAVLPDETALADLVRSKIWPQSSLVAEVPAQGPDKDLNELGQRAWVLREYADPGPVPLLRVLNGAPAARHSSSGEPLPSRPTSRSTIIEWVTHVADKTDPRTVLVVVNQPHLARVAEDIRQQLNVLGRSDLELEVVGCATVSDVSIHLLLGEIPARIAQE